MRGRARTCADMRGHAGNRGSNARPAQNMRAGPRGEPRFKRSPSPKHASGDMRGHAGTRGEPRVKRSPRPKTCPGTCGAMRGYARTCGEVRGPAGTCGATRGPAGTCKLGIVQRQSMFKHRCNFEHPSESWPTFVFPVAAKVAPFNGRRSICLLIICAHGVASTPRHTARGRLRHVQGARRPSQSPRGRFAGGDTQASAGGPGAPPPPALDDSWSTPKPVGKLVQLAPLPECAKRSTDVSICACHPCLAPRSRGVRL
jgi:hypothetical protein